MRAGGEIVMPKLIVHNLGPIQDCEIELENFCVLTGPQASGKSTVAKAIFFFRTIKEDCVSMYIKNQALGADGPGDDQWIHTWVRTLLNGSDSEATT